MIQNTEDYLNEAMRQFNNEEYYKRVQKDLTADHEQQIHEFINEQVMNREFDSEVAEFLKPHKSRTPVFYVFQKFINLITLEDQLFLQ